MSEFESLSQVAERSPAYANAARKAWGDEGTDLICPSCKAHRHASTGEMAEIMRRGFPVCRKCGVKTKVREKWD